MKEEEAFFGAVRPDEPLIEYARFRALTRCC